MYILLRSRYEHKHNYISKRLDFLITSKCRDNKIGYKQTKYLEVM